ncbi:MAG: polyprenol monophosphomannose synthase [Myxococcales bacterium]|nr:polyprenol monophosphomannose synthase [Myxococcales bacterium]
MEQEDPTGASRLLVVTPTYNERENLRAFARELFAHVPDAHVLVVDDASPDGTGALADELAAEDGRVHVLHRRAKLGLGSAYIEGFAWALARPYGAVAEMDADLSHSAADLPRLLAALTAGADLALGSRNIAGGGVLGWGPLRHVVSKGGSLYARLLLGVAIADMTTGFKVYNRRALRAIEPETLRSNGYSFQIETTYRALLAGLSVVEVPIVFVDRRVGRSKMNGRIFAEAVVEVPRLRLMRLLGSS